MNVVYRVLQCFWKWWQMISHSYFLYQLKLRLYYSPWGANQQLAIQTAHEGMWEKIRFEFPATLGIHGDNSTGIQHLTFQFNMVFNLDWNHCLCSPIHKSSLLTFIKNDPRCENHCISLKISILFPAPGHPCTRWMLVTRCRSAQYGIICFVCARA